MLLNIADLIGHLHPLLVHLPIGFLLLAILLDLLAYRSAYASFRAAVPMTLFLGFVAAAASSGTGYLLSPLPAQHFFLALVYTGVIPMVSSSA